MENLIFDSSGTLINNLKNFYFELNGVFNNTNISPFHPINNIKYTKMSLKFN
jgi:hypothetical protein